MLKESVTLQDAVDLLNGMLKADNHATASFIASHVQCNEELANHPTIQATGYGPCAPSVGPLGVLNGLFGIDENGWGGIVAIYDGEENNRKLTEFITKKELEARRAKNSA